MRLSDLQAITHEDLLITRLGPRTVDTPLQELLGNRQESVNYVTETDRVLVDDTLGMAKNRGVDAADLPAFNPGGPRRKLFFDPSEVTAAIEAFLLAGIATTFGLLGLAGVLRRRRRD